MSARQARDLKIGPQMQVGTVDHTRLDQLSLGRARSTLLSLRNTAILCLMAILIITAGCYQKRRPERILVPNGYIGWVVLEYGVQGAPPLPVEDGYYLVRIPPSGRLETSTPIEAGLAKDEYYYYAGTRRFRLQSTDPEEGKMVWGGVVGGYNNGADAYRRFFVGSGKAFKEASPRAQPGPLKPLRKHSDELHRVHNDAGDSPSSALAGWNWLPRKSTGSPISPRVPSGASLTRRFPTG